MKQKFNIITSTCVPLPLENVDTDQIIPARFLKATTKEGFGENLFRDWRYDKEGNKIASFVLNDPTYGGQILVAGKNYLGEERQGFWLDLLRSATPEERYYPRRRSGDRFDTTGHDHRLRRLTHLHTRCDGCDRLRYRYQRGRDDLGYAVHHAA